MEDAKVENIFMEDKGGEHFYGGIRQEDVERFEENPVGPNEMNDKNNQNIQNNQNNGVDRSEPLGSNNYEDVSGELKSRNQLPNDCYPGCFIS